MCKAKSPETKVGGSVGNSPQAILYSVDGLVHKCFTEVKLYKKKVCNS